LTNANLRLAQFTVDVLGGILNRQRRGWNYTSRTVPTAARMRPLWRVDLRKLRVTLAIKAHWDGLGSMLNLPRTGFCGAVLVQPSFWRCWSRVRRGAKKHFVLRARDRSAWQLGSPEIMEASKYVRVGGNRNAEPINSCSQSWDGKMPNAHYLWHAPVTIATVNRQLAGAVCGCYMLALLAIVQARRI
jgi:hypothetical protein